MLSICEEFEQSKKDMINAETVLFKKLKKYSEHRRIEDLQNLIKQQASENTDRPSEMKQTISKNMKNIRLKLKKKKIKN